MEYRIIKSPSKGALDIIMKRKSHQPGEEQLEQVDAIGLVQGQMIEMIYVADLAEKIAGVIAVDIRGNCPQTMMLLALLGDTAAVETAIAEIKRYEKEMRINGNS